MNKFWVVWNPAVNIPMRRHVDIKYAISEADMLATRFDGEFVVLEAVYVSTSMPTTARNVTHEYLV